VTTKEPTQAAIGVNSKSRSFTRIFALARSARLHAHLSHRTTFADFKRLRTVARRSVGEVWGHNSEQIHRLDVLLKKAFDPLYQSADSACKVHDLISEKDDADLIEMFTPMAARGVVSLLVATARRLCETGQINEVHAVPSVPVAPPETPGEVVTRLKENLHLTIEKLAEKANLSISTVSRLIGGDEISASNRVALSDALGCNPDLLRWNRHKQRSKTRAKKDTKVTEK
jgi:plasmid maintenance system antidote protein VapI